MVGYEEIILSIVAFIGSAGIIGASLTYYFDKRKQIKFREQEYKETRYKAIILQMRILRNPDNFRYYKLKRPDWQTINDVENELEDEWYNSILFASDDVIKSLKEFILKPDDYRNYAKTAFAMRKDLWNKKTSLEPKEIDV